VSSEVKHKSKVSEAIILYICVSAFPRVTTVAGKVCAEKSCEAKLWNLHPERCPFAKAFKTFTRRNILQNGNTNFTPAATGECLWPLFFSDVV
jgi:hypothetical protein